MRAEHGLSVSAYEVLCSSPTPPDHRLRMAEIADRVLLSRSGCTRLVDRLVEQGYVTRCGRRDRRARAVRRAHRRRRREVEPRARRTHREGVRACFLDHLSATDEIALGDIWTRFLAATPP